MIVNRRIVTPTERKITVKCWRITLEIDFLQSTTLIECVLTDMCNTLPANYGCQLHVPGELLFVNTCHSVWYRKAA